MEFYIYRTYDDWYNDKSFEIIEGNISILYNGLIAVDTLIENKNYRQIFSPKNNFALVGKSQYGLMGYPREINIYADSKSWQKSSPDIVFNGEVCESECSDNYFVFVNEDGFKHYISLNGIFSVVYER
ncbi:hypothetical protein [uncultured Clostridium sp.]|uniref:hypothetical protein n=1 Tax=uncultured Clostridium sp. TaxID=59620 RepID=UPI0025DC1F1A|nr:hypothetical protein [uncultured Clostridium sp.]